MAIVVASGATFSVLANVKSVDQVSGRNQYIGKGRIQLVALPSAVGMQYTLNVGGVALIDDQAIPFFGTTGGMSAKDNVVVEQAVAGGRVELFLRNTTGGTLTNDFIIYFTPT